MFGLRKPEPAPEGPVEFIVRIEVARPAADVYRLIDWADPANAKVEQGHSVVPLNDDGRQFRLVMEGMEDLCFTMTVVEEQPGRRYAYSTDISPPVGRLEASEEHYRVDPIDDDRCMLELKTNATFQRGLNMKQFEQELAMMSHACQRGVAKLKLHAEQGVDAVHAFDRQTGF